MYAQVEKPKGNKSQTVINAVSAVSQKQNTGEPLFQFVDNRPETIVQRKLQEMANNSPRAIQVKVFQEMANKSSLLKKSAQLQTKANHYTSLQKRSVQRRVNSSPFRGGANAPLQFQRGVLQAIFDLDGLGADDNATYTALMELAGPGWPAVKKHRLAPLEASPCTAVEVLGYIRDQSVAHGDFAKLAAALTACGSSANYDAVYALENNLDNIPTLVALSNSGDEAVQLLASVGLVAYNQLLTTYPKANYNPVEVIDAYDVRDEWAGDVSNILYHYKRHVKDNGLAHTIAQYTAHAKAMWATPVPPAVRTPTPTGDGTKVRVGTQGGSFRDGDNKIFTAWYQDD